MKSVNLILVLLAVWAMPTAASYVYEANQALIDLQSNYIATSFNFNTGDDQVGSMHNLGFTFDFYGEAFTQARMATNGCLHFKSSGAYCNDYTPDPLTGQHTYTMYPFWTDLIRDNGSKMLARNFDDKTVFGWYNLREYNRGNTDNSFEVILWQNDNFEFRYGGLNVINHDVLIGEIGASKAEAYTYYYHDECNTGTTNASNCVNTNWNSVAMNTTLESGGSLYGEGSGNSIDCSDALSNSSCAGYAAAYLTQQCGIDSLYSNDCPLYWEAYDDQQCALDPQYAPFCQGYTTTESVAYFNVEDDYGYQEEDMWYDEEFDEWLDPNDPCYQNGCENMTDADWYALDVQEFGQDQADALYGGTVVFNDDGMVDFDQSDMAQYDDLDMQFDLMDQEVEEFHAYVETFQQEHDGETFDILGGYGTEALLEDFEFQVLVIEERIRMEEEQYEEFEQFEDFEDFEENFEEQFEEYLEEERYAEEDFEEEFYPEEEIFEEEFVEEIFEDIQEMREEMIEEERLVELEESFEAEELIAEEIPATIAFAEPAKKSDKATRRANIRKLVAGTIAAATGSTDYSGSTAGASASQTGTSASSGGSGGGGNMSVSSSPSMSDQFASSSQQTQQVLSMSPSSATSSSSVGGGMSSTSSSSDSSTSISITPMPGMGGGASGAMVDVQVSNLSGEIDTAMSGAMTASEADSIADQIVAANIEAQQEEGESTQEETGKYGDESTLVAYLGYVPGFNAYTNAQLPKQTSWYEPRALDGGVIGDNVLAFYELAGTNMRNMTAMVNSQPNLLGE